MLPSKDAPDANPHSRLRIGALVVMFVTILGALIGVVAGNGVLVPPAPPPPESPAPTASVPVVLPSDWYVAPTVPVKASPSPVGPASSGSPGATPEAVASLPASVVVTATGGSRYGDTWSFEPVFPADYTLDLNARCRWSMQLADGRTVSTAGPASDRFCGAWRVTLPYVPPADRPSDYPAVVVLEMSGRDAGGQVARVTSSPYKATPLDGILKSEFTTSNLPLLWLDGSVTFDAAGKAQLRLHWLGVEGGAVDSITTVPAGLVVNPVTNQVYEVTNNGTVPPDAEAVIIVAAHDPSSPDSALAARLVITQPGS